MQRFYSLITLLIALVIGTALFVDGAESPKCACAPNSTYTECGTHCESTCSINSGQPRSCDKSCAKGNCYCNDGYARNADGNCVDLPSCKYFFFDSNFRYHKLI